MTQGTTGSYSQEPLTHFQCGSCGKWWSIADIESAIGKGVEDRPWYCPWCGTKQTISHG